MARASRSFHVILDPTRRGAILADTGVEPASRIRAPEPAHGTKAMARIALHYNPDCNVCVRQAQRTARLDWLGRVDVTTEDSPLGAVPKGEIVVVDKTRPSVLTGLAATRKVCMQIPLYFPFGLLLHLLPHRMVARREMRSRGAGAREI